MRSRFAVLHITRRRDATSNMAKLVISYQPETPRGAPRAVPSSSGHKNTVLVAALSRTALLLPPSRPAYSFITGSLGGVAVLLYVSDSRATEFGFGCLRGDCLAAWLRRSQPPAGNFWRGLDYYPPERTRGPPTQQAASNITTSSTPLSRRSKPPRLA